MTGRRRTLLAGAALLSAPSVLRAQGAYPSRPVTLIVPFPPGGTTDIAMRALAEAAGQVLPQPVIVENRPGAASTLGAAQVARARPDGYTLTQLPAAAVRVQLLQKLAYDTVRDFTPIANITGYPYGLVCRKDRFPGGWAEFVAEARRRPGALAVGNTGANNTPHVGMLDLAQREGIELNHVAFRGDADGSQALLGGHIDAMAGASSLGSLVDGGQARWLHVWSAQRLRRWPDAPTLIDLGYRGMVVTAPFGIVGPTGMDPVVVRTLHDAFRAATRNPAYLAVLDRYDMTDEFMNSDRYAAYLRDLVRQEGETIRRLNLTAS